MYKHGLKRVIDFILVFIVLVVIWPILLLITIWLHFANKGAGAFFTQERPGKDGRIFRLIKFNLKESEPFIPYKALLIILSSVIYTLPLCLVPLQ